MKFHQKIGRVMRVYGHSMAPTLQPGAVVLVRVGAYEHRSPRRGEIVAARPAGLGGKAFVKRIVGLPNERVTVEDRQWQLSDEQFFLLGDQPEHSLDSRVFGPVSRAELVGPVRVRVWPWKLLATQHKTGERDGETSEMP